MVDEEWKYRTETCTVPPGAVRRADNLFTAEVRGGREGGEGGGGTCRG